jgi:phosphoribosylamine--glycine ligase
MPMRVLVLGGGAREHALAARLSVEPEVADLVAAPGNPGIAEVARLAAVDLADPAAMLALAEREAVDLTVVGPELPLSVGVVDRFAEAGAAIVGPTRAAAALEASKGYAKTFMARHGVPTAPFEICDTEESAQAAVRSGRFGYPVVLKADGLAAGKGVVIARNPGEAEAAIRAAMHDRRFGVAGDRLVIEQHLTGTEVSFFVLADGARALPIGTAQDHKRIFDGDRGPNTGGMGAFSPSPLVDASLEARIMRDIVEPVVRGMAAEGHPFRGFLYAGLMLTADGPHVIEFNVRLGDPEAQVIVPGIEEPLIPLLAAAAQGRIGRERCRSTAARRVGVVLASRGYPDSSESGRPIRGIAAAAACTGVSVFQAGTAVRDGSLVTAGGRVLTVVGTGADFAEAIDRAYEGVSCIHFDGMQFRRDIGQKARPAGDPT